MRPAARLPSLLVPFLLLSCAPSSTELGENQRPSWSADEALQLAAEPSLVIGTQVGEPYQLARVAGGARLMDGRIVIADGGSGTLRFYDSTGTFLSMVGGAGEGPGEFRLLMSFFALPGDTLVAGSIIGDGEMSYFTGSGEYLQRIMLQGERTGPTPEMPMVLAPLDGTGTRLIGVIPMVSPYQNGERWIDSFPVKIVDAKNAELHSLGTAASMEAVMHEGRPNKPWFSATAAFASDGRHIYLGFGSEYAIRVYSATGVLERVIQRAWTPTEVTQQDIDTFVEEWGKRWIRSTGAEAETERAELRKGPYATTVPAFSQLIADRVGRLWVREARLGDAAVAGALDRTPFGATNWSLFDPKGVWLGEVAMPERFWPTDIGADYVLGIARDEDDVSTVVMYRLGRAVEVGRK